MPKEAQLSWVLMNGSVLARWPGKQDQWSEKNEKV